MLAASTPGRLRILVVGFILLALTAAFRLYHLETYHSFASDEGNNGYVALNILRNHEFILRGVTPHFGAVAHYITAGFFALFGPSVFVARLVPALSSVGASLVLFIWLRKLAGTRGAILGSLLALFCPWMVIWSRITWEMAPNVLFISLAAFSLYQYMRTHRMWLAGAAGLFLGLAVNGHLYIIVQAIPYGLAILLTKIGWRNKMLALLLAVAGGFISLAPFLYASLLENWDLFSNYTGSGGSDRPQSILDAVVRTIGVAATFLHTLGSPLSFVFLAALGWAIRQAWRKNELARFLVLAFFTALLLMPFIVADEHLAALDRGWCGTLSAWQGVDRCIATQERYFDIIYPLPLLLVAWFIARTTRRNVGIYLLVSAFIIAPLVPETFAEINAPNGKERLEHLAPALEKLPDGSCLVIHSAYRDYARLWTIAGNHRVLTLEEYRTQTPACDTVFLVSAFVERRGPHLEQIETVSVKGYELWHVYRVLNHDITDLACPETIAGNGSSGLVRNDGFTVDKEHPEDLLCDGSCAATWQFKVTEEHQGRPLHILADCKAVIDDGWLELSLDGGKSWQATCDQRPYEHPQTHWIDTGLMIESGSLNPIEVNIRADTSNSDQTGVLRELRTCYDVPVSSEEMILTHPLKWI